MHIVKDDNVLVISGEARGKTGRVLKVLPKKRNTRRHGKLKKSYPKERLVIVEGVNFIKKHTRKGTSNMEKGGIIEMEAPIHISNVMLLCPSCNQPTRVKVKVLDNGEHMRVCSHCDEMIPKPMAR
jgi:large subunit ribosomal protein L24